MTDTPKRILIVEDNEDLSEIYKLTFETAGFGVRLSPHGIDGIVQALDFQPDVILLDLMLPQMDGYEVLSAIHNNSTMDVKVIVCSNLSQQSDIDRALELGADHYLRKSDFRPNALAEKVLSLLVEQPQQRTDPAIPAVPATSTFSLPDTVTSYFEVSRSQREAERVVAWLEEKNLPPTFESRPTEFTGFLPPTTLGGLRYQGAPLLLHLQRRCWAVRSQEGKEVWIARTVVFEDGALLTRLEVVSQSQ